MGRLQVASLSRGQEQLKRGGDGSRTSEDQLFYGVYREEGSGPFQIYRSSRGEE